MSWTQSHPCVCLWTTWRVSVKSFMSGHPFPECLGQSLFIQLYNDSNDCKGYQGYQGYQGSVEQRKRTQEFNNTENVNILMFPRGLLLLGGIIQSQVARQWQRDVRIWVWFYTVDVCTCMLVPRLLVCLRSTERHGQSETRRSPKLR